MTASMPYGRSDGGWMNSTPLDVQQRRHDTAGEQDLSYRHARVFGWNVTGPSALVPDRSWSTSLTSSGAG